MQLCRCAFIKPKADDCLLNIKILFREKYTGKQAEIYEIGGVNGDQERLPLPLLPIHLIYGY